MLRHYAILLALLYVPVAFADETAPTQTTSPDEIAKLIDQIDQLEKRVKELERQISRPQTVTVVPQYQPHSAPPNQPYIPNTNSPPTHYQPTPAPYTPQMTPGVPYHPRNQSVPDSWKPFNFNGMQYYIIPVDEAERMNRPQDHDRTER